MGWVLPLDKIFPELGIGGILPVVFLLGFCGRAF
jgi:hypothetical protein